MITAIKAALCNILFLIFLIGASPITLQKTSKWIKKEGTIKVHKGLSPLSSFTSKLTS